MVVLLFRLDTKMANVSEIFQMPKEKKYAAYEALVKKTIQAQDVKGVEALVKHCKFFFRL